MNPIRILLLDNHTLVRTGLRLIIEAQTDMVVVGEAGSLDSALDLIASQTPDIILLELDQGNGLGLDCITCLTQSRKQTRVILVTSPTEPMTMIQAIQNGVLGIIFVDQPPEVMVKAIQKVHAGEAWIDRVMIASLINSISNNALDTEANPERKMINQLSQSEKNVIQLIGKGLTNRQIASQLCLSEITIRHHLTSIYNKLGVANRLELLVFAHRCGLIEQKT